MIKERKGPDNGAPPYLTASKLVTRRTSPLQPRLSFSGGKKKTAGISSRLRGRSFSRARCRAVQPEPAFPSPS